jgi:hydroxylaminobenzene mutase
MNASALSQQGRRLLQFGVALLLFSGLEGFAIPYFASPRIGLSVHTLSALQAVIFLGFGLLWPKLNLGPRAVRVAFLCAVYPRWRYSPPTSSRRSGVWASRRSN